MKNVFGAEICEINELANDKDVERTIIEMFSSVLRYLGISPEKSDAIMKECLELAKNYDSLLDYEKAAHKVLEREGVVKYIPKILTERAEILYNEIRPFLAKGNILDLGCGDGRIGRLVAKRTSGSKVVLADVYKHHNIGKTGLDFKLFGQEDDVPFEDNTFDITLVLTVLHHADDSIKTIKEAYRVTKPGGMIIVDESVFGVNGEDLSEEKREKIKHFISLDYEQQMMVNIFFDHFYNRVIHYSEDPAKKVNVPFNLNTPKAWKKLFEENGFKQEKLIHLGSDLPMVPEYHTLHVLRVQK